MSGRARKLAVGAIALAGFCMGAGAAQAAEPTIVIENGKTAPAFGYADAIRERVFIPLTGVDQDGNGVPDRTAIDIIRSKATNEGLKAPAIIDPSPYYTTGGRGNESQRTADLDGDGLNDRWPLFYDNYFVPRGYVFIHAYMDGTGHSTGCPMHGGPGDVTSMKAVIDWLNGRTAGVDKDGNPVTAPWHNGKAAMIGKSYDGTLANGVAATGVDGLTTIVPISAISQWYEYSRTGGIRHNTDYPNFLAEFVTDDEDEPMCAASRAFMNANDGDEHGDVNQFWLERDHLKDADKVKASVFITHGLQDDNVRFNQATTWWDALEARGIPLKMWLTRTGHEDPFDFRRAEWVDTLHRWFDHWLQGLDNGIMNEPKVDIEVAKDTWETAADWPVPGTAATDVYLRGTAPGSAGNLGLSSGGATDTLTWTDTGQNENTIINNPTGSQANRLVFLSAPLTQPLRFSGTPVVDIKASLSRTQSNLGAVLVDYGPSTQVTRSSDGIIDASPEERDCWGESSTNDSACYKKVQKPTTNVTQWRVSKGILDSSNRESLLASAATPVEIGTTYRFTWPTFSNDFVFAAGHQIGIVLVANYTSFGSVAGTTGSQVTLDTRVSKVRLPVVGGYPAAVASGAFAADTDAPVLSGMPADIAVETTSADGIAVTYTPPTATDDEDPNPAVECVPASGSVFAVGTTTVTCQARDAHGNTSSQTFKVTVTWIDEDDGDVGGEVPGTLSLTVSGSGSFGAFIPGIGKDYVTTLAAGVTSTAAEATLSVSDAGTTAPGHLVNGAFALPQALQAQASSAGGTGGGYAAVGGSPTPLLAYAGPVSNDAVTIGLKQPIASTDALRTGTYSKTLTFTLSTTAP